MTRAAAAVLGLLAAGALRCAHGGRAGEGPVVWDLRLAGVRAVDEDDLREKLATRQRGPLERLPLLGTPLLYSGEEPRLDRDALQVDRRRIEAYYRQRGYYATSVGEGEVLALGAGRVRVVLRVEEGPPVTVTAVEVVGLAEAPEADARLRDLPLRAGAVFTEAAYDATRERILSTLLEEGYATAKVEQSARVVPQEGSASARYQVDAGPRWAFGPVRVEGTTAVPEETIRRQAALEVKTGRPWKESKLAAAQARLFGLGVFGAVRVGRGTPDPERGVIPVVVEVREAPFRTVRAGPGLAVDASRWRAGAMAGWTHRNAFGALRRISLDGRAGYAWLPSPWGTSKEAVVGDLTAEYYQPGAISDRIDFSARAKLERGMEPAYDFWSQSALVALPVRLAPRWSFVPSYNAELYLVSGDLAAGIEKSELACVDDRCVLSYFEQRLRWDGTNDPLNPKRGLVAALSLQEGFRVGSHGYRYLRVVPEVKAYWSPSARTVLGARLRVGALVPVHEESAPPVTARFLGGGPGSMRGFATTRLSPYAPDAEGGWVPVGGNGLLDGSVELRVSASESWSGALFLDMGNVSDHDGRPGTWRGAFDPGFLQWAGGLGLRYATPVGPLRVDVAVRIPTRWERGLTWREGLPPLRGLPPGQDEPTWAFHFSLGDTF
ncbi:MAG TPA: BamA/TamA family outer membrane protein [Anaeromyxobacteraceae bacterium]|nr:BamA/TamA family outer membrane protein [Anaeromyxobacteraceae bacterium]